MDEFMPYHTLWDAAIEYKHSEEIDMHYGELSGTESDDSESCGLNRAIPRSRLNR